MSPTSAMLFEVTFRVFLLLCWLSLKSKRKNEEGNMPLSRICKKWTKQNRLEFELCPSFTLSPPKTATLANWLREKDVTGRKVKIILPVYNELCFISTTDKQYTWNTLFCSKCRIKTVSFFFFKKNDQSERNNNI